MFELIVIACTTKCVEFPPPPPFKTEIECRLASPLLLHMLGQALSLKIKNQPVAIISKCKKKEFVGS